MGLIPELEEKGGGLTIMRRIRGWNSRGPRDESADAGQRAGKNATQTSATQGRK